MKLNFMWLLKLSDKNYICLPETHNYNMLTNNYKENLYFP